MTSSGFQWVVSPEARLIPAINKYGQDALVAIQAVATHWGQFIQDQAREEVDSGAHWQNWTHNAKSGLFFAVDGFGFGPITGTVTPGAEGEKSDVAVESGDASTLIIAFGHTVFYGKFLETSNGGKYAVVMSTIEKNLPKLERMLIDSLK